MGRIPDAAQGTSEMPLYVYGLAHPRAQPRSISGLDVTRLRPISDQMSKSNSTTVLTLIPKISNPTTLGDYRPISLSNFSSKIISKVLASRLGTMLPKIVDLTQNGFIKGRSIHESIALVQELIQSIDKKTFGGNIVMKVDISKAYDRMEWRFVIRALRSLGFAEKVVDLIYRLISAVSYTISVQGNLHGMIKATRGLKQGDPLSPMIFILAQQIFSYGLTKLHDNKQMMHYDMGPRVEKVTHLLYADDMLLFFNGGQKTIKNLKILIDKYALSSGQMISYDKSSIYCSKHITSTRINNIKSRLQCKVGSLPFTYLGSPIFKGYGKVSYFEELIHKIVQRLESWRGKFLSFAGKITLLKAVLSSLPIHILSATVVPKKVIQRVEKYFKSFLWGQNGEDRTHWVSWNKVCTPKAEGGLGLRRLQDTVDGLNGKLAWSIIKKSSLWSKLLNKKYRVEGHLSTSSSASRTWKCLLPHVQRLLDNSTWIIGKGDISFWTDNWSGSILFPEDNSDMTFKEAQDITPYLPELLTPAQMEFFNQVTLDEEVGDNLIYTNSKDGLFSVKSYIKLLKEPGPHLEWSDKIWHPSLPAKYGAFLWKVINRAVPVDGEIMRKGIMGPFKCNCCEKGNIETSDHLFILSDVAKIVWDHLENLIGRKTPRISFTHFFMAWMKDWNLRSQIGYTTLGIFGFGIWEIWRARCQARFQDIQMNPYNIIRAIIAKSQLVNLCIDPKKIATNWESVALERLRIPIKNVGQGRGSWYNWKKPALGEMKLNVDGEYKSNVGTVGGIVR
ncbi:hypothetical protein CASFOL_002073 [Castilleja foliolosa]|uniref:Reverse transcriptase domain-containing protein n=1 Tax=Castilleja foliolosa TaxID=1961234 RepID=A0ABD3EDM3_9LAMI